MKVRKLIGGFVVFLFCLIIFISINMKKNIDVYDTIAGLDYGCYGNSYFGLSIKNECAIEDIISALEDKINYALFADNETDNNIKVRSLFFNNKYAVFPMEKGRFFKPFDFNDNQRKAVIGKELQKLTFKEERKSFILLDDVKYEVIGVIGFENKTIVDNICFINGNTDDKTYKLFQMDIFENNAIDCSEKVMSYLSDKNIMSDIVSGGEKYSDYLFPKLFKSYLYIILILISFLCTALMLNHWIEIQKSEFFVRVRVGADFKALVKLLLRRIGLILTIVGVVSFFGSFLFYDSYVNIFLNVFCFLVVVSFILCIIKIQMFKRWSVE